MPVLDLRFPAEVRDALRRLARGFGGQLTHPIAAAARVPEDDEDLADFWRGELRERIDADMDALRALLADPALGVGPVELGDDAALAALRGFTVLRLALRNTVLREIPDEALETGEADRQRLRPSVRHGYACYAALGELQAALCDIL